jgi:hypothetical protein
MAINLANNNSLANITALPSSISGGAMTLISEQTASSSATISFTSGIDSTYDSYVFKFINCHPATNSVQFLFNGSTDGGSNYNVVKTTTNFSTLHAENDSFAFLGYQASADLAQSTNFVRLNGNEVGADNDQSLCATLKLFNPSSTTFVKHFISDCQFSEQSDHSERAFVAGYFNTTSAINAVQFKFSSGNIDSGVIKLYGVS